VFFQQRRNCCEKSLLLWAFSSAILSRYSFLIIMTSEYVTIKQRRRRTVEADSHQECINQNRVDAAHTNRAATAPAPENCSAHRRPITEDEIDRFASNCHASIKTYQKHLSIYITCVSHKSLWALFSRTNAPPLYVWIMCDTPAADTDQEPSTSSVTISRVCQTSSK